MSFENLERSAAAESLYDNFLGGCQENPTGHCVRLRERVSEGIASAAMDNWLSYQAIKLYVERLIGYLQREELGLTAGSCVALYSRLHWEAVVVLLAASCLQLPILLLDAHEQLSVVCDLLHSQNVRMVFVGLEQYNHKLRAVVNQCLLLKANPADRLLELGTLDAVLQMEGTTRPISVPKRAYLPSVLFAKPSSRQGSVSVVGLSHIQLAGAADAIAPLLRYNASDVICFLTESLFHPFFIVHMMLLFQAGAAFGAELSTLDNIRKMNTTVLVGPGATLSCFYEQLCKEGEKLRGLARRIFTLLVDRPPLNEWSGRSPRKSTRSGIARAVMRNIRDFFLPRYRLTVSGISRLAEDTRVCLERVLLEPVLDVYGPLETAGVFLARTQKKEKNEWFTVTHSPFYQVGRLSTLMRQDGTLAYGELHVHVDEKWIPTGDLFRFVQEQGPDAEEARFHLLSLVDRVANIVLCADSGASELNAALPEPMQLSSESNSPPFLSLCLMERACQRSTFIRQSWISFQSPRTLLVILVPVRDVVGGWLRMQEAVGEACAGFLSKDKLDTEAIRCVCNDTLFQEAVVCDMRRVLLCSRAIREDWFDALSWEIYFEPQLDESYFDLGFTPHNGLLSPAFELDREALRSHYAKQLGIPVPRASLERGTLLAEEWEADEVDTVAETTEIDNYEPETGADADTPAASGLQRWLLALWSTLRADLVEPLLDEEEDTVHRPFWQRLFQRHTRPREPVKSPSKDRTADMPSVEAAAIDETSLPLSDTSAMPSGTSAPQESGWMTRLFRPAWDSECKESALPTRPSDRNEETDSADMNCLPLLLSARDPARQKRFRRQRPRRKRTPLESYAPRWPMTRFWNAWITEVPPGAANAPADSEMDHINHPGSTAAEPAAAEIIIPRWRRWLGVAPSADPNISHDPCATADSAPFREESMIAGRHRRTVPALSISDSEMTQFRQRSRRKKRGRLQDGTRGRFWRWWMIREFFEKPAESDMMQTEPTRGAPPTDDQGSEPVPGQSSPRSVDSLSEAYRRSVHVRGLP
jgi:long-subunit acyl-CoA synthetase (AMP-forming)